MTAPQDRWSAMRHDEDAAHVERVLCDPALAHLVNAVTWRTGEDSYRSACAEGFVEWSRRPGESGWAHEVTRTGGRNPLGDQRVDALTDRDAELRAGPLGSGCSPTPLAYDTLAQLFDSSLAPEVHIDHPSGQRMHGHPGEHGFLGLVQARAPFVASGRGVARRGWVESHLRTVDVAPTLAALLGLDRITGVGPTGAPRPGAFLARQDGDAREDLLDGERPDHLVVFLLDGTNANALWHAVEQGDAPHIAALVGDGLALRHGCFASLPTATLANHTTALTGAHPGHSGVLHNVWYDRGSDRHHNLLDMQEMFGSSAHIRPDVETLHEAIHRGDPRSRTHTTFEFADRGADWSTFAEFRAGRMAVPGHRPGRRVAEHPDLVGCEETTFMTRVDDAGAAQAVSAWADPEGLPLFQWVGFAVTDAAGHEAGPHSELARAAIADSDERIGEVLAAVERAGVRERTAVVVLADHGMADSDPAIAGSLAPVLAELAPGHRLVDESFVYLDAAG